MVNRLDLSIRPINRSKLTRSLIPQKLKKAETDVSSLLGVVSGVVIYYDLWMSKTTQEIFLMIAYYTRDRFREHAHIGMPITTPTDCESLVVLVGNLINQLNLGSKMVCISNDGRTNLARCRDILESTF